MSEALTDHKPQQKFLKSEDSGHDSGQSSLNTGKLNSYFHKNTQNIYQAVSLSLKVLGEFEFLFTAQTCEKPGKVKIHTPISSIHLVHQSVINDLKYTT